MLENKADAGDCYNVSVIYLHKTVGGKSLEVEMDNS